MSAPDGLLRLRPEAASWRAVEDEVVVLTADERYLGVNPTGAALWKALGEGATREQLHALLVEAGADDALATRDVEAFLADLRTRGLLQD